MPYDDTRFSHWDDPDDEDTETDYDDSPFPAPCDIIGICIGCETVGLVNVYHMCEFCMDDMEG